MDSHEQVEVVEERLAEKTGKVIHQHQFDNFPPEVRDG